MAEQNFANHGKLVPAFHFFLVPVFVFNFVWTFFNWKKAGFHFGGLVALVVAAALVVLTFLARIFALGVQDRVIRLEEQLRFERLLPADLKARMGEFTVSQYVSLRFASDAELPELARKVLDGKVTERKAIKQMVKNWKPDYLRV
jgi:uncharacterized membrane protein YciS (DUF1049 family)